MFLLTGEVSCELSQIYMALFVIEKKFLGAVENIYLRVNMEYAHFIKVLKTNWGRVVQMQLLVFALCWL